MLKVQSSGTHGTGVQQSAQTVRLGMRTGWNTHDSLLSPIWNDGKRQRPMGSERAPRAHTTPATVKKFNGRRLLARNIGNTGVRGAIDTGATRSFIGRELANRIARQGRRKRVTEANRLADKTNRTVTEVLEVQEPNKHNDTANPRRGDRRPATGCILAKASQQI